MIASVALATVAGFVVAVLPGGLGVREGVLDVGPGPRAGLAIRRSSRRSCCGWSGWPPSWRPRRSSFPGFDVHRRHETAVRKQVQITHDQRRRPGPQRGGEPGRAPRRARARVRRRHADGPVEFIFVDDGSRDGSWAVLAELAGRDPRVPRDPVSAQLRQGGRPDGRVPGRSRRPRLHARRRPPGRPGRDPPLPAPSSTRASTWSAAGRRPGTTPGTRSIPAGSSTGWSAA